MSHKELVLILTFETDQFSGIENRKAQLYKTDFFSVIKLNPNNFWIPTQ